MKGVGLVVGVARVTRFEQAVSHLALSPSSGSKEAKALRSHAVLVTRYDTLDTLHKEKRRIEDKNLHQVFFV